MATLGQYNLDEMIAQEVYEASAIHLLEQGEKSVVYEDYCAYSGEDGICCAAGIFTENYIDGMEGCDWGEMINRFNQKPNHGLLVTSLQIVHDSYPVWKWLFRLTTLPERYPELNLDNSFLDAWKWSDEDQKYYKE